MRKLIIISSAASVLLLGVLITLILNERCNVATVYLNGRLTTDTEGYVSDDEGEQVYVVSSQRLVKEIESAADKSNMQGLILDVNSEGGSVVAAEEIFNALRKLEIPIVALVRDVAFSAAYTAASAAKKIFLQKSSQVGAIGVTASYLANYEKNVKEGFSFQQLTSAKFKDLLNPNKPLTDDEKELLQGIISDMHENVVSAIAQGRGLDIGEVRSLADGSIYVGENAIENKLADQIGGTDEAREYLKSVIGKRAKLCEKS